MMLVERRDGFVNVERAEILKKLLVHIFEEASLLTVVVLEWKKCDKPVLKMKLEKFMDI